MAAPPGDHRLLHSSAPFTIKTPIGLHLPQDPIFPPPSASSAPNLADSLIPRPPEQPSPSLSSPALKSTPRTRREQRIGGGGCAGDPAARIDRGSEAEAEGPPLRYGSGPERVTRAEIVELITQIEAKNPTPAPTESLPLLNGKWILAYTSFALLFPLLGSGMLPELVKVEEISQRIDSEAFTVQNSVQFTGPLASTSVTTNAKFEVRSPKRVQIKFEEGIIGTPQLTDSLVIPDKDAASSVARTINGQPLLKIQINSSKAESWLLTTYLEEELRISRGDGNSVFVFLKEGPEVRGVRRPPPQSGPRRCRRSAGQVREARLTRQIEE